MHIDIITLMPQIWESLEHGVISRSKKKGIWQDKIWPLRDFSSRKDKRVDDKTYGGGPGMVIEPECLQRCMQSVINHHKQKPYVIQMDPAGEQLDQTILTELKEKKHLAFICARYEGIDNRFTSQKVDLCLSVGEYVLSGGDLPAMLVIDALTRLLPGTVGNAESIKKDSFQTWLLDHPHYTRPKESSLGLVPKVLYQGNQKLIEKWRRKQSLIRTLTTHKHRFLNQSLSEEDIALLSEYFQDRFKSSNDN